MYQVYDSGEIDNRYLVIDLYSLACERMDYYFAMQVWTKDTRKSVWTYNNLDEVFYWTRQSLQYPLFSAGLYGSRYVVLLEEYRKCVVIWEKQGVGVMVGDYCIAPGLHLLMSSRLDFIYKDGSGYWIKFVVTFAGGASLTFMVQVLSGGGVCKVGSEAVGFSLFVPREAFLC